MPYKLVNGEPKPIKHSTGDVLKAIKEQGIKFIELQFTGLMGRFHHTTVNANMFDESSIEDGMPKLDGSSIRGFSEIHESDMVLKPDPNTFAVIPWIERDKTARMICDVHWGYGGGRLARDPRAIGQKAEKFLKEEGYNIAYWGPEVEFFVFDRVRWDSMTPSKGSGYSIESREAPWSSNAAYPIRLKDGYLPATPNDTLTDYRNECVDILNENFGVICDAHHHEVATGGQCEIDIYYDTLTNMADGALTYKYVVKNIARKYDMVATMMPKPVALDNGSGMHVNVSLWNDKNEFYDPNDKHAELSQLGRYFGGGIMEHAMSLSAIVAPTTNSYRRLVPGYEAPVYIAWSKRNRSAIVRIPTYFKGEKAAKTKRIEFRAPDPSCNPYLCFAAILAAGLDGIRKKSDIGDPVDEDIYKMSAQKRNEMGIKQLPGSLKQAIEQLESDNAYLKPLFSDDTIQTIIEMERKDSMDVSMRPHPHEFHLYFDL
ncbi:MAG: glutamine synthetase [Candidatus Nitrosomirales archaeon]|jgi:glutamine synthetase